MADDNERLLDAITAILPPTLTGLDALAYAARHLHPPGLPQLVEAVLRYKAPVEAGLAVFADARWPDDLKRFAEQVETSAREVCAAFDGLEAAVGDPNGVLKAYRSMRRHTRATEALYPIAGSMPAVSRFFLEDAFRDDAALLAKLAEADPARDGVGVRHFSNGKDERGGFSLYVPEYYDPAQAYPLIFALHGGSGHGRDYLWTWVKEARARGAILVAPTSIEGTWSLTGPDEDTPNLEKIAAYVAEHWMVDPARQLLTGMSDGGTYSYVHGLREGSRFTHLAPSSAAFHPMLLTMSSTERLKDLPIYLMHGALDWMFPIDMARQANAALSAAGAAVIYREIEDLSHTYPREENAKIMDWLLA
ncbi:MAG: phospholipase [Pseudomonadota bacterium]